MARGTVTVMDVEPLDTSPLDLEESLPMQRVFWRFEWALFGLIVLVMVASLAGLFGDGWLSRTEVLEGDLMVRHERFVRLDKSTIVEVAHASDELAISREYFEDFRLEQVVPAPASQRIADDDLLFTFDADPGRYTARFYLVPLNPGGWTTATLRSGDTRIDLSQFTFP